MALATLAELMRPSLSLDPMMPRASAARVILPRAAPTAARSTLPPLPPRDSMFGDVACGDVQQDASDADTLAAR